MPRSLPALLMATLFACFLAASCSHDEPSVAASPTAPGAPAGKDGAPSDLPPDFLEKVIQAFAVQQWEELVFALVPPDYSQVLTPPLWSAPYEISVGITQGEDLPSSGEVVTVKVRVQQLGTIPDGHVRLASCSLFEIEGTPPEGASFTVGLSPTPWNFRTGPTYVHQLVGDGDGQDYQFAEPERQHVGPLPWRQPQVSLVIEDGRDLITRALTEPIKE